MEQLKAIGPIGPACGAVKSYGPCVWSSYYIIVIFIVPIKAFIACVVCLCLGVGVHVRVCECVCLCVCCYW